MEIYLIYIGKSAIAAGAFYLAFLLLFQNQKHFSFNRIYLPVSLALSFLIPLITFTTVKYIEPVSTSMINSFAYLPESIVTIAEPQFVFEWYHYLFGIYILGSIMFLFHLALGHLKAISIIRKSRTQKFFDALINITIKDVHPFSFFSKIVISENTLSHPNLKMIVEHENIHVKEKHTIDILFAEILFLFQWFNPFAWLIKDAMKNNLEYLTDHQIVQNNNAKDYQLAMVALADKQGVAPFLNALNGGQLKNRIIMMKKKKENKYAFVKQLLVLPLLAVLVMGLSNKEVKTETIKPVSMNSDQVSRFVESENVVKGKVINEKDEPISGASVIIKGKTIGTITNNGGEYEMTLEDKNEILVFTKPGYLYREVNVKGREKINVLLYVDKKAATEAVIVTGYATKQEADISNSLTNDSTVSIYSDPKEHPLYVVDGVETDNIEVINPNNIKSINVLKGESATTIYGDKGKNGVVLITTKTAGSITKTDDIKVIGFGTQIRPTTTFESANNNGVGFDFGSFSEIDPTGAPIYIIDGIEIKNIENIAPDNIESISVLKDKSATDIYGEKGKNGVILITTKKPAEKTVNKIAGNPLIIVDGKEFSGNVNELPADEIASMNVIKNEEFTKMYGEKAKDGVIVINTKTKYNSDSTDLITITNPKTANKLGEPIFYKVEEMPEFLGGELALRKFLDENIDYPEIARKKGIRGKVYVTFIIDKKGKVNDAKIARGLDPSLDKEAVRIVSSLPDWKPGKQRGQAVNVSYTVPVDFVIKEPYRNTKSTVSTSIPENVLYIVDGKETGQTIKDINPETIQSVIVLKNESATKKYGEKGKNGVIEITLKNGKENTKITSQLKLRELFAKELVYPIEALASKSEDLTVYSILIDYDGNISTAYTMEFILPEIVVEGIPIEDVENLSDKNWTSEEKRNIFRKEFNRVKEKISKVDIEELKGKSIGVKIRYKIAN